MNTDRPHIMEESLDKEIERLIGKQLREGLSDPEFLRLQELIAQRSRMMRPSRKPFARAQASVAAG